MRLVRVLASNISSSFLSSRVAFSSGQHLKRGFAGEAVPPKDKFVVKPNGSIEVTFAKNPFVTHKCTGPEPKVTTSKDELLKFFNEMSLFRRVEVVSDTMYKDKLIRGFLHLYNGQEAVVSGYEAAVTKQDHVITAYRDHAHFLGRGGTPYEIFCELMGKKDGCSGGKGGSMHMYKKDANYHGGNGIVGAQCPVGAGIAFALKYKKTNNLCLTFYGDGAANQGQLFEAYNMAALWKLPVIFVCENNKYGMGTSAERASAVTTYYTRGDFIPGLKIDAMNVLSVKQGVKWAADFVRAGNGPLVLEMETYRYMGHSMSDPGLTYRTKEEVAQIRKERDPIEKVKAYIVENNIATEDQLKEIDKEIRKEVDDALQKAKNCPYPDPKALYSDVYTDKPYFVRAVELPESVVVT